MNEAQLPGPLRPDPARALDAAGARSRVRTGAAEKTSSSAAFQVLLERLQRRAAELEEASRTADDPARLAGAVDAARASLEDAQTLSDRLLEAFRGERQRQSGPGGPPEAQR